MLTFFYLEATVTRWMWAQIHSALLACTKTMILLKFDQNFESKHSKSSQKLEKWHIFKKASASMHAIVPVSLLFLSGLCYGMHRFRHPLVVWDLTMCFYDYECTKHHGYDNVKICKIAETAAFFARWAKKCKQICIGSSEKFWAKFHFFQRWI